jgi:ABC-type Fe3+ transport system substrate-binding protein
MSKTLTDIGTADYYGVLSFLVNTDVQPDVPQGWADLLDPKYKGQVALSGDPHTSNQAIQSVYMSWQSALTPHIPMLPGSGWNFSTPMKVK